MARTTYDWPTMTDGEVRYADFPAETLVEYAGGWKTDRKTVNGHVVYGRPVPRAPRKRGLHTRFLSALHAHAKRHELVVKTKTMAPPYHPEDSGRRVRVVFQFVPVGEEWRFAPVFGDQAPAPGPAVGHACPGCGQPRETGHDCGYEVDYGTCVCGSRAAPLEDGTCGEFIEALGRACGEKERL